MSNGARLLLIDDDVNLVNVIRLVCTAKGYEFHAAHSAAEGLEKIVEVEPDLIILDVMMEYLSEGFDVARRRRREPGTSEIPIVMLTGVDQMYNYRMEVDESWVPCDRYLEKPISPKALLSEIETLIG